MAGQWLFHCHSNHHMHGGMMGLYEILPCQNNCSTEEAQTSENSQRVSSKPIWPLFVAAIVMSIIGECHNIPYNIKFYFTMVEIHWIYILLAFYFQKQISSFLAGIVVMIWCFRGKKNRKKNWVQLNQVSPWYSFGRWVYVILLSSVS